MEFNMPQYAILLQIDYEDGDGNQMHMGGNATDAWIFGVVAK